MSEQPETESLEDRIANQFESEQPGPVAEEQPQEPVEAEAESQAQPEFADVEYEGKTYQVPPELKDALLRQSDYTKKTTEAAERARQIELKEQQLKAAESERKFNDSVRDDVAKVQEIDFQIKQWKAVDVTGLSPTELWQLSQNIEKLKEARAEVTGTINQKWNGWQQEQQQLAREALQKANEIVAKSVQGWGPEAQKAVRDYALSEGYTTPEIDSMTDPRLVKTLWKAQQFDKLQSQKIEGKVRLTPTIKPGSSNPMPQAVKDKLSLQKTLKSAKTSSDKAKAIERALMDRF